VEEEVDKEDDPAVAAGERAKGGAVLGEGDREDGL